jgi:PmbA protein
MLKSNLTLIENGVLKSFYHNTATAKYFNTKSTGHASRGAKSSLRVSPTNWIISTGVHTESDVTEGTYLEILDTMGIGRGDNISGEFSFAASGYLCKNGVRIQPVKEITIAGNFNQLLKNISRMGNALLSNDSKSMFSPKIRFSELSVAGK